jgi:class 3 adenylate cyclase/tetratricopeptide (TPR) repeat protein
MTLTAAGGRVSVSESVAYRLVPFVPRLVLQWLRERPDEHYHAVDGTLAFVDISGFTTLTERLARKGKVGAERMNDVLDSCFAELLAVAYDDGAGLVKWGGDAVLLLFDGEDHATRACRAAAEMQRTIRRIGKVRTPDASVNLRMSVGIHSGTFDFFLVGDVHRELLIAGPAATRTVHMESTAQAGEVVISPETASGIPARHAGEPKGPGFLLRGTPDGPTSGRTPATPADGLDLDRCLPLEIRNHILGPIEPEHRQVAVAFVEFRGVDASLEKRGAAATTQTLATLVGVVEEECARQRVAFFESDIAENGGKIMLVAGAPRTHGQDEERILTTARRIVDRTGQLELAVRIGVNTGRVFAGEFGPPFRHTYSIKGDAVNVAARLMGKAFAGHILATEAVVSRARTPFAATRQDPLTVKGKSQPIIAFDVGHADAHHAGARPSDGPFVGREREMSVLSDALEASRRGTGRVVELVGEPGHGKSRLVEEILRQADDVRVLTVACRMYEQEEPYFPFRVLLRGLFGLDGDGPNDVAAAEKLVERVSVEAPDLVAWVPLIGVVVDVDIEPTSETQALAPEYRRTKLHDVVTRLLERTLRTPTALVFEDAHWMDDASTDLLRAISLHAATLHWFVLVTRRDDEGRFRAPLEPHVTTVAVEPLDAAAASELLRASTEDDPLPAHDLAVLARRARGNPLYLRELVQAAREAGSVEDLPGSVEALVAAEIDRLASADRAVLRQAAVLGTAFDADVVAALFDDGAAPTAETWRRLETFVVRDDATTYRFVHDVVRDAAYEGLAYRRRQALHARAAKAIASGERPEERAELLSLHFHYAGMFDRSLLFSTIAADRALEKFALVEAAAFYLRAIEAARRTQSPAPDIARLSEALGDVQERIGRYGEANAAYRAARVAIAGDAIAEARLLLKQAWIPERAGRYADALRWIRRGLHALEGVQGSDSMRLRAQLSAWYAAVRQGQGRNLEAIRWCRQAIEQAEASDEWDALAQAYFILDWAFVELGRYGDATNSERALEIYERLGNLGRQATIWNNLGGFAYWRGRWDEALELYEKARSARLRLGDVVDAARGTNNIGEVLSDQGRLDEAEELFRDTLRVWRAAKFSQGVALVLGNLGRVASRSGRFDEAEELFAQSIEGFARIGAETDLLEIEARIAECYVFQGRFQDALEHIAPALVRARAMGGVGPSEPALLRLQGCALLGIGSVEEAVAALLRSVELSRQRESEYDRALALSALADAYRLAGADPTPSEAEAEAILASLGVVRVPDGVVRITDGVVRVPDAEAPQHSPA